MRYNSILIFIMLLMYSCIEPYEVRSINFDRAIVVDGRITNEIKTHSVKLSYTRPVNEIKKSPVSGAEVWVEDSDGIRMDFLETQPGLYETDAEVAGVAGKSYRLFFITDEDKLYQSAPQVLMESSAIDSIYGTYWEEVIKNTTAKQLGIQLFVDSHSETNKSQYYKYEFEETYEVRAAYPTYYDFSPDPDTVVAKSEEVSPCYVTTNSSSIILATTSNLSKNHVSKMPIRYLTTETDHLRFTYSILVKQYAISSPAYNFYRAIVANNESNGSFFDKQLGTVVGNITCVEDSEENVLGFFEVSGISKKRAFFKNEEFDRLPLIINQHPCSFSQQFKIIFTVDSLEYYVKGKQFEIITAEYKDGEFRAALGPRYCTDCRFRGPTEKPDFWIDE